MLQRRVSVIISLDLLSHGDVPPSSDDVKHMLDTSQAYFSASTRSMSLAITVIVCSIAIDFSSYSPRAKSATPVHCGVSGGVNS